MNGKQYKSVLIQTVKQNHKTTNMLSIKYFGYLYFYSAVSALKNKHKTQFEYKLFLLIKIIPEF